MLEVALYVYFCLSAHVFKAMFPAAELKHTQESMQKEKDTELLCRPFCSFRQWGRSPLPAARSLGASLSPTAQESPGLLTDLQARLVLNFSSDI